MEQHEYPESTFSHREPCPQCGSKDNLVRYTDGHAWCFGAGCGYREPPSHQEVQGSQGASEGSVQAKGPKRQAGLLQGETLEEGLPGRKLTPETCLKFGAMQGYSEKDGPCLILPYRKDRQIVAQKLRFNNKGAGMPFLGHPKGVELFGQHLWSRGKKLIITEGEIDAMSVSQIQGHKWPVVSIINGASGALRDLKNNLGFLENFEEIVLMFDNDEAGRLASSEVAEGLGAYLSIKVATLPLKDASDMLVAGRHEELLKAMWDSKPYRPDGVVDVWDLKESFLHSEEKTSVPYPWPGLNKVTHGLRQGELVTLTAGTGVGKSAVVRSLAYFLHQEGHRVGMLMLEENTKRTVEGFLGLHMGKRLEVSREGINPEEVENAFDSLFGNRPLYLYDHFGSTDIDVLLSKVRYMAVSLGCRYVILDHLSIVVSGIDNGDERKSIDVAMTRLRQLVEATGIGLILVSHLKRPEGNKGFEEGLAVTLSHLRGSQSIAQLSDMVLALQRNKKDENLRHWTEVVVLKNRLSGEDGCTACWLQFDTETGQLTEGEPTFDEKGVQQITLSEAKEAFQVSEAEGAIAI